MIVNLYTLPHCGICHMIKLKMQDKNIPFNECDFNEIANKLNVDRAPVLEVISNVNIQENPMHVNADYILYPTNIVNWINQWEE